MIRVWSAFIFLCVCFWVMLFFAVRSALAEVEPIGCGLSKIWWFEGVFQECCKAHDKAYDTMAQALWDVDREFLACMVMESNSFWYLGLAAGMYGIAHAYGLFKWKGKLK